MDPSLLDATFWITVVAIFVLLTLSGCFSGSETALTAASRGKLRSQADRGSKGSEKALEVTEDSERLIGSILLGNNVVNTLATSMATAMLTQIVPNGVALATLIMTLLILIFAEVLPKTFAITNPELVASRVALPISFVVKLFSPVVSVVRILVRFILRLFGVQTDPDTQILAVHEEIAGALQLGHTEGLVEKEERDRILGALDLNERAVEEIMLHRSNIEMVDAALPPQEILSRILQSKYTRHPVYRDDPENIVGVIHAKDLLRAMHELLTVQGAAPEAIEKFDVMSVAMDPYFVPETTTLGDQMRQFLKRRAHFALVVDEYGGLQGLITLEDILEEIVGEIADEFDDDEDHEIEKLADGTYLVDGATTIRDLNRAHDWNLPDDEANTVAGLVIYEAQMIPVEGQVFSFHGFRFEVVTKDENRIADIKVRPL